MRVLSVLQQFTFGFTLGMIQLAQFQWPRLCEMVCCHGGGGGGAGCNCGSLMVFRHKQGTSWSWIWKFQCFLLIHVEKPILSGKPHSNPTISSLWQGQRILLQFHNRPKPKAAWEWRWFTLFESHHLDTLLRFKLSDVFWKKPTLYSLKKKKHKRLEGYGDLFYVCLEYGSSPVRRRN